MKRENFEIEECSKKDWLELISKSLKKGSIDDFIWQIDENVRGEPFAHFDDLKSTPQPIISTSKSNNWLCGLDYSLIPNEDVNEQIKHHSRSGLESFMLYSDTSNMNFDSVFKGVELDKYDILLNTGRGIDRILFMEKLKDYCLNKNFNHKKLKINLRLPVDNPEDMLELYRYLEVNFPQVRFFYRTDRNLTYYPAQYLTETFNALTDFIRRSELDEEIIKSMFKRWKIHLFMTEKFLAGIAMLRAFKIVWANYIKAYNAENASDKIIMGMDHNACSGNFREDLITSAIVIAIGAISGVHSINISPVETEIKNTLSFMSALLNIQHIVKHESHLHLISDPMAGSYAIETATNRIAEEVWANLK